MAQLVQEHHGVQQQDLLLLLVDVDEVDVEVVAQTEQGVRAAFGGVGDGGY